MLCIKIIFIFHKECFNVENMIDLTKVLYKNCKYEIVTKIFNEVVSNGMRIYSVNTNARLHLDFIKKPPGNIL